ncbi:MAG: PDZ domain-containing protein [Pirellulaceae bacterium]
MAIAMMMRSNRTNKFAIVGFRLLCAARRRPIRLAVAAALFFGFSTASGQEDVRADVVAKKFAPSLVAIERSAADSPEPRFVEYATGVVISHSGQVMTHYHLLGDIASSKFVVHHQGHAYHSVTIVAADAWTDLAILRVDQLAATPIEFAANANPHAGESVYLVGNSVRIARNLTPDVSSAKLTAADTRITTDKTTAVAAQSPTVYSHGGLLDFDQLTPFASSGGLVVDGELRPIGTLASAKAIGDYTQARPIGVCIDPAIQQMVVRLQSGELLEFGFLGVQTEDPAPDDLETQVTPGLRVTQVVAGTPAEKVGLQFNDILVGLDDQPISSTHQLLRTVGLRPPLSKVSLQVLRTDPLLRRQRRLTLEATLAKKHIRSVRPSISQAKPQIWRGISVDFATAVPDIETLGFDLTECVVVTNVQLDSPAWQSGLRPGMFLHHWNGKPIGSPQDFWEQARQAQDESVRITSLPSQAMFTVSGSP